MSAVIVGTGHDLPEWVLTNDELEAMGVGYDRARAGRTLDQWAVERIGVRSRHRVRPGEGTSDMGARAARCALADAGLQIGDLGLIVVSTYTSDYPAPSTAALIQAKLGASCKFFQLDVGCVGFVDAAITTSALMDFMEVEHALVVSTDALTLRVAPDDFMAQCLFGDGAGAVILKNVPGAPYGLKAHYTAGDGSRGRALWLPGGGTLEPISEELLARGRQYAVWAHKEVYQFAVEKLVESCRAAARRAGWDLDEVTWFIPHQAGRNIILEGARCLDQPEEKFIVNIGHTGNTSAASVPIALGEIYRAGKLKDGDKLIMPAMGSGLAWGALAVIWHDYR